jgi:glycerol kinase
MPISALRLEVHSDLQSLMTVIVPARKSFSDPSNCYSSALIKMSSVVIIALSQSRETVICATEATGISMSRASVNTARRTTTTSKAGIDLINLYLVRSHELEEL